MKNEELKAPIGRGNFAKNAIYFSLTAVLIIIISRVSSLLMTRILGPENKGIYAVVVSSIAMLVVFGNMGLGQAVAYFAASEKYSRSRLWSFLVIMTVCLGACLTLIAALGSAFLGGSIVGGTENQRYLFLGVFFVPALLWRGYARYFLLGSMRFSSVRWLDLIESSSILVLVIFMVFVPDRLLAALIIWSVSLIIQSLGLFLLTKQQLRWPEEFSSMLTAALNYGGRAYVNDLLQMVNYRLDIILVGYFLSPLETGLYAAATSIAEIFWILPRAIAKVLFPRVSSEEPERAKDLTPQVCRVTLFLLILFMAAASPALPKIIPLVLGDGFYKAVYPALLLMPGVLAFSVVRILYSDLSGQGSPEFGTYSVGIGVVLTLILDLILIPRFGVMGAAIASSISYTTSGIAIVFFYTRRTGTGWRDLIIIQFSDLQAIIRAMIRINKEEVASVLKLSRFGQSQKG